MNKLIAIFSTFTAVIVTASSAQAAICIGTCRSTNVGVSLLGAGTYTYVTNNGRTDPLAGRLPGLQNATAGSEYTTDTFTATAGQVIRFNVNFGAASQGGSFGFAQVINTNSGRGTALFGATDFAPGFSNLGQLIQPALVSPLSVTAPPNIGLEWGVGGQNTGWTQISYVAPLTTTYAVRFGGAALTGPASPDPFALGFSNITLGGATVGDGSSPTSPLLPSGTDPITGGSTFRVVVSPNLPIFIDPLVATGYDYSVTSGQRILSAIFPELGDPNGYQVFGLNGGVLGSLLGTAMGGTTFSFGANGVSAFALRDISTGLALDPTNPTAFVTGLTLNVTTPTVVNLTQTPVTTFVPDNAVPEPATWAMMLAGFGMMGAAMRSRTKMALRHAV